MSGGCGGRMDSGTTYIFPETYNDITIFKGPQDVRFGALSFGGVLFDNKPLRLDEFSAAADVGFLYGSFNQIEATANALAGNDFGSIQAFVSRYSSGDYKSADKTAVHSANKKEAISLIATLTPEYTQAFELRADFSRGYAAYADRTMDARTLDRTSLNFHFNQELNSALNSLDLRAWFNTIDHIMDNYSHRPNLTGDYNLTNPQRTNIGTRVELGLNATRVLGFLFGVDYNNDTHSSRNGSGINASEADSAAFVKSYKKDYMAHHFGGFVQGQYFGIENNGLFFGARFDALNKKQYTSAWSKTESLPSGFVRFEHYFDNTTLYAGAGVASRGADFWELNKTGGESLRPEQNAQLDVGAVYQNRIFYFNASLFASGVKNYILIDWTNSSTLQTNAVLFGGEFESVNKVANAIKAEFGLGELNSPNNLDLIYSIIDNLGREKQARFITEPQLYFVLMRSDKPKAKPFRQWVINEVLPSIRKSGKFEYEMSSNTNHTTLTTQSKQCSYDKALNLALAQVNEHQKTYRA